MQRWWQALGVSIQPPDEPIELRTGLLGIVTDIHGNPYALERILSHGAQLGVDRWLVLGDVVAMGPEPGRVLEQLAELDVVAVISGNTERYVLTGDRPDPSFDEVVADPGLLPRLVEVAASFAWTKGFLQACGSLDVLGSYLASVRLLFPDGTDVLAVHASLLKDDGPGITPSIDAEKMETLFPGVSADIVFGGHTHQATDLAINGIRFVNPGSASNHLEPHVPARYATVRLGDHDHHVELHDVQYDKGLAIESIQRSGIPGSDFLVGRYFAQVNE